jgi:hypothetical protein
MEMKQRNVFLLALLMIFALAGCSTQTQQQSTQTDAPAVTQEAVAAEEAQTTPDAGVEITSYDALVAALQDESVLQAHISADMTIAPESDQSYEREGFVLTIDKDATVTIGDFFTIVFFGSETVPGLVNNGTLIVSGEWNFGAMTLENNGTIEIKSDVLVAPGMSTIQNNNMLQIDKGAELRLERGSGIVNDGTIQNSGTLNITSDGGSLTNNDGGTLLNSGHIAFDGDYQINGTYRGTEPLPKD